MRSVKRFRPLSIVLVVLLFISNISFTLPQAAQAQGLNSSPASAQSLNSVSNAPNALLSLNVTTVVTSTVNPSTYSQSVTFRGSTDFGVLLAPPTGRMDFYDGNTKIGSGPLVVTSSLLGLGVLLYSGRADFTTSALTAGTHSITAVYVTNDLITLNLITLAYNQVVNKANATTSLTSSPNPSTLGASTSLTATVAATSPATAIPTGTVTFRDGTTIIGTAPLDGTGKAVLNVSNLGGGTHSLTATYNGDTNFNASSPSSPAVTQTVSTGTTTTALSSSPNPGVVGSAVTFTATITTSTPGSFSKAGTVTFKDNGTTIGTVQANDSGVAVFSTSSLTAGSHPITAVYAGNTNFSGSTSGAVMQVINAATGLPSTSTPGGTLPSGVSYGQPVTLTVNVAGTGTPTGTVSYYDNGTLIGTQPLNGAGSATLVTNNLPAGNHTLTATYSGDGTFAPSTTTFTPNPFVVAQGTTTLAVTGPATPPVYGQNASFSVTITDSAAGGVSPSGTVTFKDNGTDIGTGTLINGVANFTTGGLTAGPHSITAVYAGDTNFTGNTSPALAFTVNKSSTSAAVNASSLSPSYGQAEVFTVQIAPTGSGSGTPSGTVIFKDGGVTIATVPLSNGMASFSVSNLTAGSHSITAEYSGDSNFAAVTSAPFAVTVVKADTTVALTSSDLSSTQGGSVTFEATVSNVSAPGTVPTGSVTFMDGSSTLQTVSLVNGVASYTTTALGVGSHSITAVYSGTANFNGATSGAITQVINSPTATVTTSTPGTLATTTPSYGQPVTLTVHVGAGGGGTPTGTVNYYDGGVLIGTGTLDGSGNATFTTSDLGAGTHNLTAEYNGDGTFAPSTATYPTVTISKANTTVTVDALTGTPAFGQPITVTVHVADTATGGNPPSGTVTIKDNGTDIGTASVGSDGTATFSTATLGAGSHNITAVYSGDSNFNASPTSGAAPVTVTKANTSVAFTTSSTSATEGSSLTFSATVSNTSAPGTIPTGTVTFKDGSTTLATITLDSNGMASYNTSSLGLGSHSITATYDGTLNFNPVTSSPTSLTITSNGGEPTTSNPGTMTGVFSYGEPVTLTVTVLPADNNGPTATGTVTFYDNNGVPIGQAPLVNGTATLTTTTLTAGDHNLTATYGGDPNYAQSQTTWPTLTVEMADTTVGLVSSAPSANAGDSVTFTATLTNTVSSSVVPTGTVMFKDGANSIGTGTIVNGVATLTTTGLGNGSHTITAVYGGTPNFNPSTSSPLTQTISGGSDPCATVTTNVDGSTCGSLRGSVNDALGKLATQDVTITISVATIDVDSALPTLANNDGTHTLTLVGLTSIDPNTGRCVAGTSLVKTGNFNGTALLLGNRINLIGLSINGFDGDGVDVTGQNNVLTCMSIGVTTPNTGDGVKITGSNNTLGSATDASMGNLISNNAGFGIHVLDGINNTGYHNWVGLNAAGTTPLKNGKNALSVGVGSQFKLFSGNRFQN